MLPKVFTGNILIDVINWHKSELEGDIEDIASRTAIGVAIRAKQTFRRCLGLQNKFVIPLAQRNLSCEH